MKLGNLQRINIDDVKTRPEEVVRKFNDLLDKIEQAMDGRLDISNQLGRQIQVDVLNGVPTLVQYQGSIGAVNFRKVLPSPLLPGSFRQPNYYWYPENNGFSIVVSWTTPEGQPVISRAAVTLFVEPQ